MSRRKITYLVLAIASVVVAACASPTSPQHDTSCGSTADSTCGISGYIPPSG